MIHLIHLVMVSGPVTSSKDCPEFLSLTDWLYHFFVEPIGVKDLNPRPLCWSQPARSSASNCGWRDAVVSIKKMGLPQLLKGMISRYYHFRKPQFVCMSVCLSVSMYVLCMFVCLYLCLCLFVCLYVCVCVCLCLHGSMDRWIGGCVHVCVYRPVSRILQASIFSGGTT